MDDFLLHGAGGEMPSALLPVYRGARRMLRGRLAWWQCCTAMPRPVVFPEPPGQREGLSGFLNRFHVQLFGSSSWCKLIFFFPKTRARGGLPAQEPGQWSLGLLATRQAYTSPGFMRRPRDTVVCIHQGFRTALDLGGLAICLRMWPSGNSVVTRSADSSS